ncbi:sushi, von Willebrand factor type A, EGF and pentraxin domain-containing protein 1-like [Gigantopelta aegis]|uniref:sushi, von Willebrand factor type A, EGF and pentraxin domain-containing protein 1-like n=1 Tax=Gigantopelta aegis TaxID=1735272 RepID=UPI001B88ADB2|nr:sushi, von Willebrand factor type A, EGF and pentraxin domain-containing protein 1-like [Gigantopelta aegis]
MCLVRELTLLVYLTGMSCSAQLTDLGLTTHEYLRLEHSSLTACKAECRHHGRCRSFMVDPRMLQCHLYDVDFRSAAQYMTVPSGTISGDNNNKVSDPCTGFSCPCEISRCSVCSHCDVNSRTRKPFCVIDINACLEVPTVKNGVVVNGVDCLMGVSRDYTCNHGYTDLGNGSITCSKHGTWSTGVCEKVVSCMVPTVANGTFIHQSTTLGSEGSVECDKYFRFFGNSSSAKCNATGHWSGLEGDCRRVEWRNMVPPFEAPIPWTLSDGWELLLVGTPGTEVKVIHLDWMYMQDIYVRVGMRFNIWGVVNKTVFSARYNGKYREDLIVTTSNFPFVATVPFEMRTTLQNNTFAFVVDGADLYTYNILRPAELIDRFVITDEVTIDKLLFIYNNTIY